MADGSGRIETGSDTDTLEYSSAAIGIINTLDSIADALPKEGEAGEIRTDLENLVAALGEENFEKAAQLYQKLTKTQDHLKRALNGSGDQAIETLTQLAQMDAIKSALPEAVTITMPPPPPRPDPQILSDTTSGPTTKAFVEDIRKRFEGDGNADAETTPPAPRGLETGETVVPATRLDHHPITGVPFISAGRLDPTHRTTPSMTTARAAESAPATEIPTAPVQIRWFYPEQSPYKPTLQLGEGYPVPTVDPNLQFGSADLVASEAIGSIVLQPGVQVGSDGKASIAMPLTTTPAPPSAQAEEPTTESLLASVTAEAASQALKTAIEGLNLPDGEQKAEILQALDTAHNDLMGSLKGDDLEQASQHRQALYEAYNLVDQAVDAETDAETPRLTDEQFDALNGAFAVFENSYRTLLARHYLDNPAIQNLLTEIQGIENIPDEFGTLDDVRATIGNTGLFATRADAVEILTSIKEGLQSDSPETRKKIAGDFKKLSDEDATVRNNSLDELSSRPTAVDEETNTDPVTTNFSNASTAFLKSIDELGDFDGKRDYLANVKSDLDKLEASLKSENLHELSELRRAFYKNTIDNLPKDQRNKPDYEGLHTVLKAHFNTNPQLITLLKKLTDRKEKGVVERWIKEYRTTLPGMANGIEILYAVNHGLDNDNTDILHAITISAESKDNSAIISAENELAAAGLKLLAENATSPALTPKDRLIAALGKIIADDSNGETARELGTAFFDKYQLNFEDDENTFQYHIHYITTNIETLALSFYPDASSRDTNYAFITNSLKDYSEENTVSANTQNNLGIIIQNGYNAARINWALDTLGVQLNLAPQEMDIVKRDLYFNNLFYSPQMVSVATYLSNVEQNLKDPKLNNDQKHKLARETMQDVMVLSAYRHSNALAVERYNAAIYRVETLKNNLSASVPNRSHTYASPTEKREAHWGGLATKISEFRNGDSNKNKGLTRKIRNIGNTAILELMYDYASVAGYIGITPDDTLNRLERLANNTQDIDAANEMRRAIQYGYEQRRLARQNQIISAKFAELTDDNTFKQQRAEITRICERLYGPGFNGKLYANNILLNPNIPNTQEDVKAVQLYMQDMERELDLLSNQANDNNATDADKQRYTDTLARSRQTIRSLSANYQETTDYVLSEGRRLAQGTSDEATAEDFPRVLRTGAPNTDTPQQAEIKEEITAHVKTLKALNIIAFTDTPEEVARKAYEGIKSASGGDTEILQAFENWLEDRVNTDNAETAYAALLNATNPEQASIIVDGLRQIVQLTVIEKTAREVFEKSAPENTPAKVKDKVLEDLINNIKSNTDLQNALYRYCKDREGKDITDDDKNLFSSLLSKDLNTGKAKENIDKLYKRMRVSAPAVAPRARRQRAGARASAPAAAPRLRTAEITIDPLDRTTEPSRSRRKRISEESTEPRLGQKIGNHLFGFLVNEPQELRRESSTKWARFVEHKAAAGYKLGGIAVSASMAGSGATGLVGSMASGFFGIGTIAAMPAIVPGIVGGIIIGVPVGYIAHRLTRRYYNARIAMQENPDLSKRDALKQFKAAKKQDKKARRLLRKMDKLDAYDSWREQHPKATWLDHQKELFKLTKKDIARTFPNAQQLKAFFRKDMMAQMGTNVVLGATISMIIRGGIFLTTGSVAAAGDYSKYYSAGESFRNALLQEPGKTLGAIPADVSRGISLPEIARSLGAPDDVVATLGGGSPNIQAFFASDAFGEFKSKLLQVDGITEADFASLKAGTPESVIAFSKLMEKFKAGYAWQNDAASLGLAKMTKAKILELSQAIPPRPKSGEDAFGDAFEQLRETHRSFSTKIEEIETGIDRAEKAAAEARMKAALSYDQQEIAKLPALKAVQQYIDGLKNPDLQRSLSESMAKLRLGDPSGAKELLEKLFNERKYTEATALKQQLTGLADTAKTPALKSGLQGLETVPTTDPVSDAIAGAQNVKDKFAAFLTTDPDAQKIVSQLQGARGKMSPAAQLAFDKQLKLANAGHPAGVLGLLDMYSEWKGFKGRGIQSIGRVPDGIPNLAARRALAAAARESMVAHLESTKGDSRAARIILDMANKDRSPSPETITARKTLAHMAASESIPAPDRRIASAAFEARGYQASVVNGRLQVTELPLPKAKIAPEFTKDPLGSIAHQFDAMGRSINDTFNPPEGPKYVTIGSLKAGTPLSITRAWEIALPRLVDTGMTPQQLNAMISNLNGGAGKIPAISKLYVTVADAIKDSDLPATQKKEFLAALRKDAGISAKDLAEQQAPARARPSVTRNSIPGRGPTIDA